MTMTMGMMRTDRQRHQNKKGAMLQGAVWHRYFVFLFDLTLLRFHTIPVMDQTRTDTTTKMTATDLNTLRRS